MMRRATHKDRQTRARKPSWNVRLKINGIGVLQRLYRISLCTDINQMLLFRALVGFDVLPSSIDVSKPYTPFDLSSPIFNGSDPAKRGAGTSVATRFLLPCFNALTTSW